MTLDYFLCGNSYYSTHDPAFFYLNPEGSGSCKWGAFPSLTYLGIPKWGSQEAHAALSLDSQGLQKNLGHCPDLLHEGLDLDGARLDKGAGGAKAGTVAPPCSWNQQL